MSDTTDRPTPTDNDNAARRTLAEVRQLKEQSLTAQLQLIRERCPEVFADAERFIAATNYLPWELALAFDEGEVGALVDKYDVPIARHRPSPESIGPLADLFCEACALLYRRKFPGADLSVL